MSNHPLKVIVVGGGPVGLTAAHALSRASIDYVVLEIGNSVTIDVGASLVLWPQGLRVLAQLGLLERLLEIGTELECSISVTLGAHKFKESRATGTVKKNHGIRQIVFHRAELLRVLYGSLSDADRSRILTNKKVTDITTSQDGVNVQCGDGSTYHGSIVIGADGVHSLVRRKMRELALKSSALNVNAEKPYLCEYRALWCTFPQPPDLNPGAIIESHGTDVSLQCLTGRDRSWIFVYERLDKPTRDRVSYTQQDVEALAVRRADLPISEHLQVKDVFPKRYTAGMANLEEGIVDHWSFDRLVLVGDASHKLTPNQGLGYNNGIQDVVALVNELHGAVSVGTQGDRDVALDVLAGAFERYQTSRMKLLQKDSDASASWTRMSAWRTCLHHLLDRYIFPSIPHFDDFMLTHVIADQISQSLVLDFVEGEEAFAGKVPWLHPMKPARRG